jgi:hypothetical protein
MIVCWMGYVVMMGQFEIHFTSLHFTVNLEKEMKD